MNKLKLLVVLTALCLLDEGATAQTNNNTNQDLYKTIYKLDSAMFSVVYTCSPEKEKYFDENLEFYHDKSGVTLGRKALMDISQKNFCDRQDYKLRRELVPGTLKVFPMDNYGALQTGEHYFFETVKGRKEVRTGIAKFTHLWQYKDGEWRITRVLSYDHQPAPPLN